MSEFIAGRCIRCGVMRQYHPQFCRRDTREAVYGLDNPLMIWLREHAPQALNEKPDTAIDPWEQER